MRRTLKCAPLFVIGLAACEAGPSVARFDGQERDELARDRWLAVLGDKALLRHQEANGWQGRPAVEVGTAFGLERHGSLLASVPGVRDAADRPQIVEMDPGALAALNASHAAEAQRYPVARLFSDSMALEIFLQLANKDEDMAEIRSRVRGEPYPVEYRRAWSRSWALTLTAVQADERNYKAAEFRIESRFVIERNMPPLQRARVAVSNLRVEAFWDGEAWVAREPAPSLGPTPERLPDMKCERTGPHTVRNCEVVLT